MYEYHGVLFPNCFGGETPGLTIRGGRFGWMAGQCQRIPRMGSDMIDGSMCLAFGTAARSFLLELGSM